MSIQVALHHRTTYRYDKPVALGPQVVRLRPAPHSRTSVLSYALTVLPAQHFINWQQDPQGNHLARLVFPEKTELFEIVVDLVADMTVINPFDFFLEPEAEQWPFAYAASLAEEIAPFRKVKSAGPLLSAWLAKVDRNPQPTIDFIVGLNARLQQEIGYIVRLEPGVQEAEFVAFWVAQDVPALGAGLTDVHGPGAESEQPLQLGVLVAVGGVDVDVQSELPGPRVTTGAEDEGGLRATEAGIGRPDLDASVVLPAEFDVAEDLAPECGEPVGVGGVNDQLTDAACHARQYVAR